MDGSRCSTESPTLLCITQLDHLLNRRSAASWRRHLEVARSGWILHTGLPTTSLSSFGVRVGDAPVNNFISGGVARRRQADVRRADHARWQLVELSAAPSRRPLRNVRQQRGDLLFRIGVTGSSVLLREVFGMHRTYRRTFDRRQRGRARRRCVCVPRGYPARASPRPASIRCTTSMSSPVLERAIDGFLRSTDPSLGPRYMADMATDPRCPMTTKDANTVSRALRIGVIGFGWMGQAHSRGCRRAPSYFLDRDYEPELVVVSDTVEARRDDAVRSFGYQRAVDDWHEVVDASDVDVVFVTAPNMLHVEMVDSIAQAGKPVFCEKPVGVTRRRRLTRSSARHAGVITVVGYNYRCAPLLQYPSS